MAWYYLYKDGKKIDFVHIIDERKPFEQYDINTIIEWLNFDDETIVSFFCRVMDKTPLQASVMIDGYLYSVQWTDE